MKTQQRIGKRYLVYFLLPHFITNTTGANNRGIAKSVSPGNEGLLKSVRE
jgi:hypothetical protein